MCLSVVPDLQRLVTRAQFQAVLSGRTLARTPHFALHALVLPPIGEPESPALFVGASLWMGAMVPKRWAKRAVTRNTIKRQIYNVSQEYSPSLQAGAHLVRLRAGFDRSRFVSATSEVLKAAVRAELHQLFQQGVSP
jgi:ribonuclease P protein component